MDWFDAKPEFSLKGEWRVQSVFGAILSLGMIACIILMYVYYVSIFRDDRNQIVSHESKMEEYLASSKPFRLTPNNFRLALGFYRKPNTTFLNVDTLVAPNVVIGVEQITITRDSNGLLSRGTTFTELSKCSGNYFDGFKEDSNTDYSFLAGLANGYCLPTNLDLYLSSIASNPLQYISIRLSNKTSTTTSINTLRTMVNSYQVGLFMSVPVVDLAKRGFRYSVQQIRGQPNPVTRSFEFNLTLSKQRVTFTTPNYTVYP